MLSRKTTGLTTLLFDAACVGASLWLCGWHEPSAARLGIYLLAWVVLAERLGTYLVPMHSGMPSVLRAALETWGMSAAVAGIVDISVLGTPGPDVWRIIATGALVLTIQRLVMLRTPLGGAAGARPRVLMVGACNNAADLSAGPQARRSMDLRGFVPFPGEAPSSLPDLQQLGELSELEHVLALHRIDLVVLCPSERARTTDVHAVFRLCDVAGLTTQYFPSFLDLEHLHASMMSIDGRPGVALQSLPNRSLSLFFKRLIDIAGALAGIALLLPVFVTCAAAVKFTSKGPVFFAQVRVGRSGERFRCLKFRTMRVGAHAQQEQLRQGSIQDGPAFKIPNDPRLTRIGRLLRRYSLDELPQLFNVLFGDMSLVGPRPPIPTEVERYTWWQRRRISVKPGLTCVWQVWGRNRVSFKRWVEMDLFYIDNWSLWLDIKLILHTVRAVLRGTGM